MEKYEYCENILKERSAILYNAFSELDQDKANAVYAIYAFVFKADDAVDVHHDLEKITTLKSQVKATFEGDPPKDDLLLEALHDTLEKYPNTIDPYMDYLDAMRDDYYQKPIETEDDFDKYCQKVGGTIGLMLLPVVASKNSKKKEKELKHIMSELGKGMQITSILRDVRDDLMNRRVYFADEVIAKQQLELEITRTGLVTPEWRSTVEYYIDLSREKYNVFYEHAGLLDQDAVYPTYLAAKYYESVMDIIQKKNYTNINKQHSISKFKQFFIKRQVKHTVNKEGLIK
jgi:phytoene synthase